MNLIIGGCGYIGSALADHIDADSIDVLRRGNPGNIRNRAINYAHIPHDLVVSYDTIILLAAHSSVQSATADPHGAFRNNVVAFQRLLEMLEPRQRLIYASSSSVYSGFGAGAASENADGNMYDASKLMDDMLATTSGKRTYGLRFGTVNGSSPNIRPELMLNAMVKTAMMDGYVQIANPKIHRPILGINDLGRAIVAVVDGDACPGIYNVASFNDTVAHLGAVVAAELDVPLKLGASTSTYDFEISTSKFQEAYDFQFEETAESIVKALVTFYGSNSGSDDVVHADLAVSGV